MARPTIGSTAVVRGASVATRPGRVLTPVGRDGDRVARRRSSATLLPWGLKTLWLKGGATTLCGSGERSACIRGLERSLSACTLGATKRQGCARRAAASFRHPWALWFRNRTGPEKPAPPADRPRLCGCQGIVARTADRPATRTRSAQKVAPRGCRDIPASRVSPGARDSLTACSLDHQDESRHCPEWCLQAPRRALSRGRTATRRAEGDAGGAQNAEQQEASDRRGCRDLVWRRGRNTASNRAFNSCLVLQQEELIAPTPIGVFEPGCTPLEAMYDATASQVPKEGYARLRGEASGASSYSMCRLRT